ncbi:MAG: CAP domain-containing protein [Paracoccaceae bacterium]
MPLTSEEQFLLELINRARLDPVAEAARYGIDLNAGLAAGALTGGSRQVLAPNSALETAALGHSLWMLATDIFSHTGAGGSQPWDRATAAGYDWSRSGENIAWSGTSAASFSLQTAILAHHEGLFRSAGHRVNLLNDSYAEVGLARETGGFLSNGTNWNASMLTELFGTTSGRDSFLTGVAFADANADRFYSMGEGAGGVSIEAGEAEAVTEAAGGYVLALGAVTSANVTGTTVAGLDYSATVDMSRGNVKLDILNGDEFLSSGSLVLGTGIQRATLLGLDNLALTGSQDVNSLTGNAGSNLMRGLDGNDTLNGMDGADRLFGDGGNDLLQGGSGNDQISGGMGDDLLVGGAGADVLKGDAGNDTLTGSAGADQFVFQCRGGADRITDFSVAEGDRLALDAGFWAGQTLTMAEVLGLFASVTGQGVLFDFGADGSVLLAGLGSTAGLDAALDLI